MTHGSSEDSDRRQLARDAARPRLRTVHVPVEPMTAQRFAPYGEVFGHGAAGSTARSVPIHFDHDARVTLATIHQPHAACAFTRLERHFAVTQGFVQLSGARSVVCVAPPTDLRDLRALPDPAAVRGFLIDPALGYVFRRGTWHALERCVLGSPGATFLILNVRPNPTQIVDFATGAIELHDDLGASPPRPLGEAGVEGLRFELAP